MKTVAKKSNPKNQFCGGCRSCLCFPHGPRSKIECFIHKLKIEGLISLSISNRGDSFYFERLTDSAVVRVSNHESNVFRHVCNHYIFYRDKRSLLKALKQARSWLLAAPHWKEEAESAADLGQVPDAARQCRRRDSARKL